MAIAALVLWVCTVAVGAYLLATATRYGKPESAPSEPVSVSATAAPPAVDPAMGKVPAPGGARSGTPSPRPRCSANGASRCRSCGR